MIGTLRSKAIQDTLNYLSHPEGRFCLTYRSGLMDGDSIQRQGAKGLEGRRKDSFQLSSSAVVLNEARTLLHGPSLVHPCILSGYVHDL